MLISKTAKVTWGNRNKKYYTNKGYPFTKIGDIFEVCIEDLLPNSSKVMVECLCDYCLENGVKTIITKTWQDYKKQEISITPKDCCSNCVPLKKRESDMKLYGVNHTSKLNSTIEKMQKTNLQRYGGTAPVHDEKIKKKIQNTNIQKYGTTSPSQNINIKNKIINTNKKRYGYKSPTLNTEIRAKQLKTMEEKHGVLYPMQCFDIQQKAKKTLYLNGTCVSSKQQNYIHSILGGKLNYPFNNLNLDIAFPKEKIYVECDFGGHDLAVKLGKMTQKEFENYERKRWYLLNRRGWKEMRIISTSDKVPQKNIVTAMFNFGKKHFNDGHSFIKFNIDEGKVITSEFEQMYDFGMLLRL